MSAARPDRIGEAGRPERTRTGGPDRRVADSWAGTTDPGASPLRPTGGGASLGCRDHDVVAGGKARIVPTVLVPPAEVPDNRPARDRLWHTRFRWQPHPRQGTGDGTDGTAENVVAVEHRRVRADVSRSEAGRRPGLFADTDFACNARDGTDRCPGNETRRCVSRCGRTHRRSYEAPPAACRARALKAPRTTSRRGRRVGRGFAEDDLDRVRGDHATAPFAKAMRTRKAWAEPPFAEAKDRHGLRRFRLRGLTKANGEALLVAAGQNLKRLLSRQGWGRRPWPNGAAGVVLPTAKPVAVSPE